MLFANPVDGPRIVPYGEDRLPSDRLANGNLGFRVTQRFTDINPAFPALGQHGALDLGNFKCGDRVLAPFAGAAQAGRDSAGALRVIIDHGNGWKSYLWHLNGWTIPNDGRWHKVLTGQQVGIVGDTGLGSVCHLHWEVHFSGVKRDPWPMLEQNQESLVLSGKFVRHVTNRKVLLEAAARFRQGSSTNDTVLESFPVGTPFYPVIEVNGETVGNNNVWHGAWMWANSAWRFGYFHSGAYSKMTPIEQSGYSEAQVKEAVKRAVTAAATEATRLSAEATNAIRKLIP